MAQTLGDTKINPDQDRHKSTNRAAIQEQDKLRDIYGTHSPASKTFGGRHNSL